MHELGAPHTLAGHSYVYLHLHSYSHSYVHSYLYTRTSLERRTLSQGVAWACTRAWPWAKEKAGTDAESALCVRAAAYACEQMGKRSSGRASEWASRKIDEWVWANVGKCGRVGK